MQTTTTTTETRPTLKATKGEALRNTASALDKLTTAGRNLPPALAKYARKALADARAALNMADPLEGQKRPTLDAALREAASALAQVLQMAASSTDARVANVARFGRLAMAQARAALKMNRPPVNA